MIPTTELYLIVLLTIYSYNFELDQSVCFEVMSDFSTWSNRTNNM